MEMNKIILTIGMTILILNISAVCSSGSKRKTKRSKPSDDTAEIKSKFGEGCFAFFRSKKSHFEDELRQCKIEKAAVAQELEHMKDANSRLGLANTELRAAKTRMDGKITQLKDIVYENLRGQTLSSEDIINQMIAHIRERLIDPNNMGNDYRSQNQDPPMPIPDLGAPIGGFVVPVPEEDESPISAHISEADDQSVTEAPTTEPNSGALVKQDAPH